MSARKIAKEFIGEAFLGCGLETLKRSFKEEKLIRVGWYSGVSGLFIKGSYALLKDTALVQRLEHLLSTESLQVSNAVYDAVKSYVPSLDYHVSEEPHVSSPVSSLTPYDITRAMKEQSRRGRNEGYNG
jgi:hypothetical protein